MASLAEVQQPLEQNPPPRVCAPEGHTNVCYSDDGNSLFTSGADKLVRRFKSYEDEQSLESEEHQDAITAMAVRGSHLVTCCEDLVVRLYDSRTLKADRILTRFQSPVRAAAFNVTGSMAAVAGDEMTIKLLAFTDTSCRELRGHDGPVRWLAFDPEGDYLASSSDDGTVKVWSIQTGEVDHAISGLGEARGGDTDAMGLRRIDYHPASKYLAVPVKNTVVLYSREGGERMDAFKNDGHERRVSIAVWSPNGEYLASASVDGEVLVWATSTLESVARFKHTTALTGLAWSPAGNEIAWCDALGKFSVWRQPVPDVKKLPRASAGVTKDSEGVDALFSDSEDEGPMRNSIKKKKIMMKKKEGDGEEAIEEEEGTGIESTAIEEFIVPDESGLPSGGVPMVLNDLQDPFQPGSTPAGMRARFLCYNDLGFITSRLNEDEYTHQVYVEFHDMGMQRPVQLVDHFGCTMASLSDRAFAIAAPFREGSGGPDNDGKNASMLLCERIGHWAQDRQWQVLFPDNESIEVIAVGGGETGFVAAATSRRQVHIYSLGGIAVHVLAIPGPVVSMAARETQLIVAYHGGAYLSGEQNLSYMLLDVDKRRCISSGRLPLSPRADLMWLGFTDHGLAVSADSDEVVRQLTHDWDYNWMPIVDLRDAPGKRNASDTHWITAVTTREVMAVLCRGEEDFPTVLPKPVVSSIPLCVPVVSFASTKTHEEKYLRQRQELDQLVRTEGLNELRATDRKLMNKFRKNMDKNLLGAISRSVQNSHSGRALELTMMLATHSSFETAVRLAVKAKDPLLAERMTMMHKAFETSERKRLLALKRESMGVGNGVRNPAATFMSPPPQEDASPMGLSSSSRSASATAKSSVGGLGASPVTTAPIQQPVFAQEKSSSRGIIDTAASDSSSIMPPPRAATTTAPAAATSSSPVRQRRVVTNPFARKPDQQKRGKLERSTSFVDAVSGVEKENALGVSGSPTKHKRPGVLSSSPSKAKAALMDKTAVPRKRSKKDADAPKAPMSAYFLWLKSMRSELKAQNPHIKSGPALVKLAGEKWKEMTDDDKAPFTETYKEQKAAYKEALEVYLAGGETEDDIAFASPKKQARLTPVAQPRFGAENNVVVSMEQRESDETAGACDVRPDDTVETQPVEEETQPIGVTA